MLLLNKSGKPDNQPAAGSLVQELLQVQQFQVQVKLLPCRLSMDGLLNWSPTSFLSSCSLHSLVQKVNRFTPETALT